MIAELLLTGGTVVNQDGAGVRAIAVTKGRIAALGPFAGPVRAAEVVDCTGLTILPGVIDTQVHFREPGFEHKETLATGSLGAVLGGVTSVFEMPNTRPATTTAAALADKVARGRATMFCDFAFFIGASRETIDAIPALEALEGSAGIKVFMGSSTGNLLVDDETSLERIIGKIARRASFHAEDEARLKARLNERIPGDPRSHPVWRDETAALIATRSLVQLAEKHRKLVHVLHVSTAAEMAFLAQNRRFASVEVTPHHLTLTAPECYERLGTYAQMNPPVRDVRHREALWAGLRDGVVDCLGSDHAPHTRAEKDCAYPDSHSGMTGVQTLVPVMLDHVNKGRLSIERFVDLTSHGPQRLFGIAGKGRIAAGYDADFTVVDMARRQRIENGWIASKAGWTPYDGVEVTGWPVGTIIRGRRVMWDGAVLGAPSGQPVQF